MKINPNKTKLTKISKEYKNIGLYTYKTFDYKNSEHKFWGKFKHFQFAVANGNFQLKKKLLLEA